MMKARLLIIGAVLCALVMGAWAGSADAAWKVRPLGHYSGSDSAGVVSFAPIVTGADTLSINQLDALTTKAGAAVSPHRGTPYFTPGSFTAYGTADTSYVVYIVCETASGWESATDSLGITIQYSVNGTDWISGPETLIDPDSNLFDLPVVSMPYPYQRIIVKWNDTDTMGLPTKTMNGYVLHKE
jgi:hypothetical protein